MTFLDWHECFWFSLKISLKFAPKVPIDNKPHLVQIMAWCWIRHLKGHLENAYELLNPRAVNFFLQVYQGDTLCGFSNFTQNILPTYPHIQRHNCYIMIKFEELLDLRAPTHFWAAPLASLLYGSGSAMVQVINCCLYSIPNHNLNQWKHVVYWSIRTYSSEIWMKILMIFLQENAFENICELADIFIQVPVCQEKCKTYWWFRAWLQYIQCISNGDTAVLY